ncbi:MAG TPA: HdeD family acid-resistance protein [Vicinamibacterales bacterium]|nr:HdeD family acid-resistance protein [Vicinamibacterales bacterium]
MDQSSLLIIRGLVGIALGVLAMFWPGITLVILVGIFGVYAILDGLANLLLGFRSSHRRSWPQIIQGLVGIGAGVLTFIWPTVTALALVLFIGAWAIVTGVLEMVAAVRLRKMIKGEWLLALSGIMSMLFGALVFAFPAAGAVGIAWLLGIYAAAAGVVLVTLALRIRTHQPIPAT